MRIIYQEKCDLCSLKTEIAEGNFFYTEETEIIRGEEYPIPLLVENKTTAKKWFMNKGWTYYKKFVFCSTCFSNMKNKYVVIDRFNQFYSEGKENEIDILDVPTYECFMEKEQAVHLASHTYDDEIVYKRKALPFICKVLKGEAESDIVGYIKVHQNIKVISELDFPK